LCIVTCGTELLGEGMEPGGVGGLEREMGEDVVEDAQHVEVEY
jgi:hypothetical protein